MLQNLIRALFAFAFALFFYVMGESAHHVFTKDYTAGMNFLSAVGIEIGAIATILLALVAGGACLLYLAWGFLTVCIPDGWALLVLDQAWNESVGTWLNSTSSGRAFKIALATYSALLVTGANLTWKFGTGQKPGELSPRTWLWSLGILFMTAGFAWLIRQTRLIKLLTTTD